MPDARYFELKEYAKTRGISFLSTGFDEQSVDFLDDLGMDLFKIPSGEITNRPYLEHIASKGKPVILSTGMSNLEEIQNALQIITSKGVSRDDITVLHCNTEYPTPMNDVNLLAMNSIGNELGVKIGYSDHTLGIEVPIAAAALGAIVIEKHFTLDRTMEGPDHLASLEPDELRSMVDGIRNIELAIAGDGKKEASSSEIKNKAVARKSIHLNKKLKAGHVITLADLEMKRPGDGISPMMIDHVLGKTIKHELPGDHKLALNDIR